MVIEDQASSYFKVKRQCHVELKISFQNMLRYKKKKGKTTFSNSQQLQNGEEKKDNPNWIRYISPEMHLLP